eukprot:765976-Hanusia_phi.AAC.1
MQRRPNKLSRKAKASMTQVLPPSETYGIPKVRFIACRRVDLLFLGLCNSLFLFYPSDAQERPPPEWTGHPKYHLVHEAVLMQDD